MSILCILDIYGFIRFFQYSAFFICRLPRFVGLQAALETPSRLKRNSKKTLAQQSLERRGKRALYLPPPTIHKNSA